MFQKAEILKFFNSIWSSCYNEILPLLQWCNDHYICRFRMVCLWLFVQRMPYCRSRVHPECVGTVPNDNQWNCRDSNVNRLMECFNSLIISQSPENHFHVLNLVPWFFIEAKYLRFICDGVNGVQPFASSSIFAVTQSVCHLNTRHTSAKHRLLRWSLHYCSKDNISL